jgi:LysR family glycine cleavage system transcriptional activator
MFECAARHLNFRIASEELCVTQGAVAQQVRALEEALGVKLFDRLPRALALTDAGQRYLKPVQRALSMIADATLDLKPRKTVITISVTHSFATKWLIPRLGRFSDANPDVEVQVLATNNLANFQSDGVDLAVRQTKPPFGAGLQGDLLFPVKLFAVCSPSLLAEGKPLQTVQDLPQHVLLHDAHGMWPVFLEYAGVQTDFSILRSVKFSYASLAIDAAIAGQGIALASEPLIEDDLASGRLSRPFEVNLADELGFFLVYPRTPRRPDNVRSMRDWLLTQNNPLRPN